MRQQKGKGNQTPLPSGDWGLQSSHRCGCGPTKGSESPIRDGGQEGGGFRLSKNFTLEEMVATSHRKLQDTPTLAVIQNLQRLCVLVLQPLRDTLGAPVYINSGYRSKRLNARVGGVANSRHLLGRAADIHCDNLDYAKVIFDILRQNPTVDKAIIERKGRSVWVHVQM